MSSTDMSHSSVARASQRSAAPSSKCRMKVSTVFIAASCATSTPLGSPVEPEVNNT
ncbi:Uncharacterised protein [Mycobacterium tuberculosis]|nr:Uncharacterised protein [Mycobacterium tuberculosis]CKR70583.1 Uncharacterised protein [Mycobacterium tuberculosis]CNW00783.1 Uncharacterised protein [Mycobacterium tuberculosis]CNW03760.1 Uncharacterised protein [Mycobacterium tuberculosis]CNW12671.1 Uncharacterised protein [Mycobacterium tuberculosis]